MPYVPYFVALAPAILLIGLVSTLLVFRVSFGRATASERPVVMERGPAPRFSAFTPAADVIDLEAELKAIMTRMEPVARAHSIALRYAFRSPVMARVETMVLRDVVSDVIATAIHGTLGGQVLLTARPLGRWIEISVIDDGPVPDDATREVQLREARENAAMRGWLFAMNAHAGHGTTVSLRLPAAEVPVDADPSHAAEPEARPADLLLATRP